MVLLDSAMLVIDVQRRRHPFGQDPSPKPAGGATSHTTLEDQLDVVGTTDVQVLADHLLEEDPARHRAVEYLSQRELRLKNRHLIAIARLPIPCRERMRELGQPLAEQAFDLLGREAVAESLQPRGISTREDAVVQRLEGDPFPGQLPFDVLMAVETELGVVGEVGTELDEKRTEVAVYAIEML